MSAGFGLLKKVLDTNCSVNILRDHGISEKVFGIEERKAYNFIVEYYREYGQLPPIATVLAETQVSIPQVPDNSIDYWIDRVKKNYIKRKVVTCANRIIKRYGTKEFEDNCESWIRELNSEIISFDDTEKVVTLSDVSKDVAKAHDARQKSARMFGIPFGIPYLDEITDGAQPGDTVAICARTGIGKTMLMLMVALKAYLAGYKPLYCTFEMSAFQNVRRLLAIDASVPGRSLKLGKLGHWGRAELAKSVEKFETTDTPFYLFQGSLRTTIEDIVARVQDIKPDVLYIDGAYLVRSATKTQSRVERISHVAEIIKGIAATFSIPVISTYQYNRTVGKKSTGGSGKIAWSDIIEQLASIVLGIGDLDFLEERKTFAAKQYKALEIHKGRDGERGLIKMLFDMQRMKFEQVEVLSGYDSI